VTVLGGRWGDRNRGFQRVCRHVEDNLGVPSNGGAGQLYTVLIRPFGGSAPTLYAVLKIRR
jgi:hypothetical protein